MFACMCLCCSAARLCCSSIEAFCVSFIVVIKWCFHKYCSILINLIYIMIIQYSHCFVWCSFLTRANAFSAYYTWRERVEFSLSIDGSIYELIFLLCIYGVFFGVWIWVGCSVFFIFSLLSTSVHRSSQFTKHSKTNREGKREITTEMCCLQQR